MTCLPSPFPSPFGGSSGISADAVSFIIADSDVPAGTDPSNILGSVSQDGDDITVTTDANTISNTPATALSWEMDIKNIYGDVAAGLVDLTDVFKALIRMDQLVPATDIWVGMAITTAGDATGCAMRLAAVSGDWQVQHATNVAGSWSAWTTSTANANTQAGVLQIFQGNATLQSRVGAYCLDATGAFLGSSATTSPSTSNIGNDFTKIRLCVGYIAGGLGTPGAITFRAAHAHSKLLDFPTIQSFFL